MKKLRFGVKGMSCAACVAHVEHAAAKICGKDNVTVSLLTNSLTVICDDTVSDNKLYRDLQKSLSSAGYSLVDSAEKKRDGDRADYKKALIRLLFSCGLTLLLMLVAMGHMIGIPLPSIITGNGVIFGLLQLTITVPVLILNFKFFRNGFFALFHAAPNMDSLIAIGSSASLLWGIAAIVLMAVGYRTENFELVHQYSHNLYFESSAMILTLVSLGKLLESRAKSNAARAISRLASMMPETAFVERGETLMEIPSSEIAVGDILLVKEGQTFPVDGIVVDGKGTVDESAVTGESMPVEKCVGDPVSAICTLRSGSLRIRAEQVGDNTSLSRIIALLEDAAASKAPIARIADKVSGVFVPIVIAISILTALVWLIFAGDLTRALESAIAVLVISCPCALGLATPTAVMVGISRGASKGILIKSSEALENLHSIDYFLTDKTGTLTEGNPTLTHLISLQTDENTVLRYAYGVESQSSHPLASSVCRAAKDKNLSLPAVSDYSSESGMGVRALVDNSVCLLGKPSFLSQNGISLSSVEKRVEELEKQGVTTVCLSIDGECAGILGISDRLRPDSREAISVLHHMGITPIMLTGDNEYTASSIAEQCGMEYYARLLPEDKEKIIRSTMQKGRCAMVGDGINDAPALSAAHVGIAIGAGTEVAIDCADVVLSKNSLKDAVSAISLSHATIRCIKQNLFWALLYNSICIPIAAGALYPSLGISLSPMIASAAMSFSSLFVVTNSLRLRLIPIYGDKNFRFKHRKKEGFHCHHNLKKEEQNMFGSTKTVTFGVEGMMCKNCKAHVEKALGEIKGVKSAVADLENKNVTVLVKSTVTEQRLKEAVIKAGYRVTE